MFKEGENLSDGLEQSGLFTPEQISTIRLNEGYGSGVAGLAVALATISSEHGAT